MTQEPPEVLLCFLWLSHTYTTNRILLMSPAFLSLPLVRSCLKAGNCLKAASFSSLTNADLGSDAAPTVWWCHSHFRRICKPAHTCEHRPRSPAALRSQCGVVAGSFICRKACSRINARTTRLSSILLSNPFLSATKGGPVRNAGKATPPPGSHVAHHLFSQILFCFSSSSEVVTVCNVLFFFRAVSAHRHICDVSLQDSKTLVLREIV